MIAKTQAVEKEIYTAPTRRILCAVDFSQNSLAALQAARGLAQRWGAKLEFVCATDLPAFLNQNEDTDDERRQIADFRKRVKSKMQTFAGPDAAAACWVWDGPADEAILREAEAGGYLRYSAVPVISVGS